MKTFQDFVIDYTYCSFEEFDRWRDLMNRLPFTDYETLEDWIKEYTKAAIEEDRKYLMSQLGAELWNIDLLNDKSLPIIELK